MTKKTQNLKPDTVLKNYWNNNEQFADLFNTVLFEGRQRIKPNELEDVDTEESSVLEHREYAESIRASKETREKAIEYTKEHEVDKTVVMTVAGAANCKLDYNALARKGDADMCTVFEETRMEGIVEGKIEGIIKMLRKYKESDEKIISELMSELEISEIEAKEYLEQYNKGLLQ